jgi:hypothetical protein
MKLSIFPTVTADGYRVVKAKAVINPSVALGIPKRRQKTWTVRTVAPELAARENRHMFEAEASRWEQKVMAEIARSNALHQAVEEQHAKMVAS